jgi:hypothetical protein
MSQDQENGGDVPANSEAPSNGKSGNDSARKDVCRDFLNKICNRGTRCKFYHPPSDDSKESRRDDFSFCIDYQVCCYRVRHIAAAALIACMPCWERIV